MNKLQNVVYEKLLQLKNDNNVPNIILYGNNKSGKKLIIQQLLLDIYKTRDNIHKYVIILNCSHGKGNIKFIRENIKYFANTVINKLDNINFKSIILLNAERLTFDAQSALRRCIEIYNHTTRFFIVIDNKYRIMKPILSRFSQIYVNDYSDKSYKSNKSNQDFIKHYNTLYYKLKTYLVDIENDSDIYINLEIIATKLYNNGFSANMLIEYIKSNLDDSLNKSKFILLYNKYRLEIREERLLLLLVLNFYYLNYNLLESFDIEINT